MDKYFNCNFIKTIVKYNGRKLEIDGIFDNIAFEYNGEQHYQLTTFFHKTQKDFEEQKIIDGLKISYCQSKKMLLLVIRYYSNLRDARNILDNIKQSFKNVELNFNENRMTEIVKEVLSTY